MRLKEIIIAFSIVLIFAESASAQALTGGLSGTVHEFLGAVVPNAKITIRLKDKDEDEKSARPKFRKSGDEEFTRTTTGNEAGEFSFSDLPAGVYEIEARAADGSSFKGGKFRVTAGKTNLYEIEFGTDCNNDTGKTIEISEAEKAEIVNDFLERAILKKQLTDYEALARQTGPIIVSTEVVKPELIKSFENVRLMNAREVQQKADKSGDFLFISISAKTLGECFLVSFANDWAIAKNSKDEYRYGGAGSSYIYRKESGKIVGRLTSTWIR
jgi:hypothetical protein